MVLSSMLPSATETLALTPSAIVPRIPALALHVAAVRLALIKTRAPEIIPIPLTLTKLKTLRSLFRHRAQWPSGTLGATATTSVEVPEVTLN